MALFRTLPNLSRNFIARYSPWMLIGVAAILALAITALAVRNAQRERAHMSQNLMDRADALIWAVEAGTRASMGMRSGAQNVQALVEETAKQAGVVFMSVTDASGTILASSVKENAGKTLYTPQELSALDIGPKSQWRSAVMPDGKEAFEVYRVFSPLPGFTRHMHHSAAHPGGCGFCSSGGRRMGRGGQQRAFRDEEPLFIFVGLDMAPFKEALAQDFRNTAITGIVVGLAALGGFISLFWAQNCRLSRRMLQDAKAFAAEVVTSMPSGLIATDERQNITLANGAASRLFGMPENNLEGMRLSALEGIPWAELAALAGQGAPVHEREYVFAAADREPVPVSVSVSKIVNEERIALGYIYLIEDIRERKRTQEQLRRNERLSALGHMAARVAHEIRNPLSSIKGFARYFAEKMPTDSGKKIAFAMMEEVDRLNRVVTELLDFARPSKLTLKPGDLRDVIRRALRLTADDAAGKGIEVSFTAPAELPKVNMDFEHLTQAFLNLFINAVQAMEHGGKLSVNALLRHDARIEVAISDTGQGMPPDVLERIFTPYFTTKTSGTGLGLAIVQKILEEHGVALRADSEMGRGTVFTLVFPVAGGQQ